MRIFRNGCNSQSEPTLDKEESCPVNQETRTFTEDTLCVTYPLHLFRISQHTVLMFKAIWAKVG